MIRSRSIPTAALLGALSLGAGAARAQAGPQLPPVRTLAVNATAAEPFGALQAVRQLPGGRVLANDMGGRRVLLFDSTLKTFTVVADSTSATGNAYSGRIGGLIPYRGDSTLFVDPQSLSMLLIDPAGKLGRVMSVPRPSDANALTGLAFGAPGFDARGHLVYRATPNFRMQIVNGVPQMSEIPDSMPLQRVDMTTRKLDTAAFLKAYQPKMTMATDENGRPRPNVVINPLPTVDDWAVLSDGTIAILRGRDFHLDLIDASGAMTSAPKVPHEWQRMSDEDKTAFLDSTRTAMEKIRAERQAQLSAPGGMDRMMAGAAGALGGGAATVLMSTRTTDGGPPPRTAPGAAAPAAGSTFQLPPVNLVPANELPDYKPAFAAGGTRADGDGRVWVRTLATKPMAGPVYDVIDGHGKLVDRVMLPASSAIVGFGPGGVVYLGRRDTAGLHLERATVK